MELNNECSALWNEALPQGLIPLFAAPERLPAKGRKVHRHQPFSILPVVPQSIFYSPNLCYKKVLFKAMYLFDWTCWRLSSQQSKDIHRYQPFKATSAKVPNSTSLKSTRGFWARSIQWPTGHCGISVYYSVVLLQKRTCCSSVDCFPSTMLYEILINCD